MDTTQHWPGSADDNFDALDFGDETGGHTSDAALDFGDETGGHTSDAALDFGDEAGHDSGEPSVIEALDDNEQPISEETGTELRAIDTLPEDIGDAEDNDVAEDESSWNLTTVTNPPETVSVTAAMHGMIHNVELSADADRMTEAELANEILVIADLARQQASAKWRTVLLEETTEAMKVLEVEVEDEGLLAERLGDGLLRLSSPERAITAQAEVFATRYTSDK